MSTRPSGGIEDGVEESEKRTTGGGSKTLVVFLSQEEYGELRRAVGEANVPNMSLLVFQAIQAGLESDETHGVQRKRTRTVNLHVSREFMEKIRLRARMSQVTQQALLRGLLFQYIRSKPWQRTQAEKTEGA
ncbi:MAG: hypothetical protein WB643_00655 [Candidatus Bathyarchaeia archaeon]